MLTDDYNLDDDDSLKDMCGKIFSTMKGMFVYICVKCNDKKYMSPEKFLLHYSEVHLLEEECKPDINTSLMDDSEMRSRLDFNSSEVNEGMNFLEFVDPLALKHSRIEFGDESNDEKDAELLRGGGLQSYEAMESDETDFFKNFNEVAKQQIDSGKARRDHKRSTKPKSNVNKKNSTKVVPESRDKSEEKPKNEDGVQCVKCPAFMTDLDEFRLHISKHLEEDFHPRSMQTESECSTGDYNESRSHEPTPEPREKPKMTLRRSTVAKSNEAEKTRQARQDEKREQRKFDGLPLDYDLLTCAEVKCLVCKEKFKEVAQLREHMKIHAEDENPPPLQSKKRESNKVQNLVISPEKRLDKKKIESVIKKSIQAQATSAFDGNQMKCLVCPAIYTKVDEFRSHLKDHENYRCPKCSKGFLLKRKFDPHIEAIGTESGCSSEDKPEKCNLCDFAFTTRESLKKHMHLHFGFGNFQCKECGQCYKSLERLRSHFSRIHTKEDPALICPICGVRRGRKFTLDKHILRHYDENRRVQCEHCPRKFFTYSEVIQHSKFVHSTERPYLCADCGASFPLISRLNLHIKRHHSDRKRTEKCEICSKSFYDKERLRYHLETHSAERNFTCTICGSSFKSSKVLRVHMQIHENKRQYKCKLCDKAFNQSPGLVSHVKVVHGDKVG